MTELNHKLRGLALGGIRRFTTLAKERGDCILLTLGEPEFDTPVPSDRPARTPWTRGAPTTRKTGETWPCARPFPNLNAGAGAWITLRRRSSSLWGPRRPFTPPSPGS